MTEAIFCIFLHIFFLIFLWREDCVGFEKKINRKKLIQSEFIRTQSKISTTFFSLGVSNWVLEVSIHDCLSGTQGINLPSPMASTNTTLPQPREHPESLNTGVNQEKQTFNTAGQASLRKVTKPSVLPKLPQLPSANGMVLSPSRPVTATPVAIAVPAEAIPASTQSYRKRKEE